MNATGTSRRRGYEDDPEPGEWCENDESATLVTSLLGNGMHAPVIDIDVPCQYVPSTTPGHGHLYFNVEMSSTALFEILDVMARHGLVERGYASASRQKGYAAVRTPWTRKIATTNV